MEKQSQVLTGPVAPTERNPNSFNRACPICGWESEETLEGSATKFAKCPKCGNNLDQPFIINTQPNELELLTHQVAKENQVNKQAQALQTNVDVTKLTRLLQDQGVPHDITDEAVKMITDKTKAHPEKPAQPAQPSQVAQPSVPAQETQYSQGGRVANRLSRILRSKTAWGDGPGIINFGPGYEPPRMAEADESSEMDLYHADDLEVDIEEIKSIGQQIGINWENSTFTPEDLLDGYNVELEHGAKDQETNVTDDDPEMTAKIAWAHLKEDPKYYKKLKKMEDAKHKIEAFLHRRAITVRELQTDILPVLEEALFNITVSLQHADYVQAQEYLHEAFALFTTVRDKIDSLGDVDPVTYGSPTEPKKEKGKNWFERLIDVD